MKNISIVISRYLYQFLEPKRRHSNWIINRINTYGIDGGADYCVIRMATKNKSGTNCCKITYSKKFS